MSYAWEVSRSLAFQLNRRFNSPAMETRLLESLCADPGLAIEIPEALPFLIEKVKYVSSYQLKVTLIVNGSI